MKAGLFSLSGLLLISLFVAMFLITFASFKESPYLQTPEQTIDLKQAQKKLTQKRSDILLERAQKALKLMERQSLAGKVFYTTTVCSNPVLQGSRPAEHHPSQVGQDCEPWLARQAVEFLHNLLIDTELMNGLEWGSGSSSMWLIVRLRSLISIENNKDWFEYVGNYFSTTGKELISVDSEDTAFKADWNDDEYRKRWKGYLLEPTTEGPEEFKGSGGAFYEKYVTFPKELDPLGTDGGKFDFVSVDGRSRVACLKVGVEKLREDGGILLLDNSDRTYYHGGIAKYIPKHWHRFDFQADQYGTSSIWISVSNDS